MRFSDLSETDSILRRIERFFDECLPHPFFDFPVSRGFWLRLPWRQVAQVAHDGREATEVLVARAYGSLRWAAFARGYRLTSAVIEPAPAALDFAMCGYVAELPPSIGYDDCGTPCAEWPRDEL